MNYWRIFYYCCIISLSILSACHHTNVERVLEETQLWVTIGSKDKFAFENNILKICTSSADELRRALEHYLDMDSIKNEPKPIYLAMRMDNARIIVSVYFKNDDDKIYQNYFETLTPDEFSIRAL